MIARCGVCSWAACGMSAYGAVNPVSGQQTSSCLQWLLPPHLRSFTHQASFDKMTSRSIAFLTIMHAALSAFASAILYLLIGSIALRSVALSGDAFLWLAAVTLVLLPITAFSALAVHQASRIIQRHRMIIYLVIVPTLAAISTTAFHYYMSEVSPATNWQRGWWLPTIASLLAAGLALTGGRTKAEL